jgi:hypothetical protein
MMMLIELTDLKVGDTVRFKEHAGSSDRGKLAMIVEVKRNEYKWGWPLVTVIVDNELKSVVTGYLEKVES